MSTENKTDSEAQGPKPIYTPKEGEAQLTVRAVLAGCLLGGVIAGMNIYMGLNIGWTVGGSLMAAILSIGFFAVLNPKKEYGILEANITQTTGSGAGTMASAGGLVAPIPALLMLGYELTWWELMLWCASIAYLGVMFAVPLRRQYVVIEQLRFPSGTATANTIVSMFAKAGEAVVKAEVLLWVAILAFGFTVVGHFFNIQNPSLHIVSYPVLGIAAAWGFSLYVGPMLFGAGFMIGPKVGISLLLGAIVGWLVLGMGAHSAGWAIAAPMKYFDSAEKIDIWNIQAVTAWYKNYGWDTTGEWGPRGWILFPGVGIMVGDALMALLLSWKTFVSAFKRPAKGQQTSIAEVTGTNIPNSWWIGGLVLAACATMTVSRLAFDIPLPLSALAIGMSAILANVAVRSTGETDINPIGGMGKVTQIAFGGLSSAASTNLLAAGITGAGASQAGDMMHDLKSGHLLGASPRAQFRAQLFGIAAGVIFVVPLFFLFDSAWDLANTENPTVPAPAAHAWRAMAEVLTKGLDALPPHADVFVLGGLVFGALIPTIRKFIPALGKYTPSGLAFGIAFLVPAFYSITMCIGSIGLVIWQRRSMTHCERFVFPVACGLIAGEGLGGIVSAILSIIEKVILGL